MTLSIEDLPAPFGPMMAQLSCSRTSKETSCSAATPPKAREMASISRMTLPVFLPVLISRGDTNRNSCRLPRRSLAVGLRLHDSQVRGYRTGSPVLEPDLGLDELGRLARIEGVDQHGVLLPDQTAAYLARTREFVVVRVEFLVQYQEAVHLGFREHRVGGEFGVGLFDAFAYQFVDFVFLREVGIARIGEIAALGPVAHRPHVDVDEGADAIAPRAESHGLPDVGRELEFVLYVVGGVQGTARQFAHVLGAVDDLEMAVGVQIAGVARVKIAACVQRLGRGVGALVVFLEQDVAANQYLAVVGDLHFDAGRRRTHGVELDLAVGLEAHRSARLGRSVELLQVDTARPVEAKQVGADRRPGSVGDADAAHAKHVAQGAVHQQIAQRVEQPVGQADRLAIDDFGAAATRHSHEMVEHAALEPARVLHADHYLGQQVLEHARRREVIAGTGLAHVGHYRVAGFGAIDRESDVHRLRVGEQMVPHPGHGKVGQDVVLRTEVVEFAAALGCADKGSVRLAYALGLAGRAGGVEHHRNFIGPAAGDLIDEECRLARVPVASGLHDRIQALQPGLVVVIQAARVVVEDVCELWTLAAYFEQLVDLLLVFDYGVADAGVEQHEAQFLRHRVLVHGHRHTAQRLGRAHGPVETRAVVADH